MGVVKSFPVKRYVRASKRPVRNEISALMLSKNSRITSYNVCYTKLLRIANFTFLNSIYLPAINYIPLGGWSVGVEMLFYLTIPFLFSKIKSIHKAFMFLAISIFCSFVIQIFLYFLITYYTHYSWVSLRRNNFV